MLDTLRGKILLTTRNENIAISLVLEEIAQTIHELSILGWKLDVLIIDDSDDDSLLKIVETLVPRLGISVSIQRGPGTGLGSAIIDGFRSCIEDNTIEFVVNLDADGQHDARQMSDLLRIFRATNASITIGSRWTQGGRCYGLSRGRIFLSRCSSFALRHSGVPNHIKDPTTSFRVYKRQIIQHLTRDLLGFDGYSFFGAAVATASAYGQLVNEAPIHFRPRIGGKSNLSILQTFNALRDLPKIKSHAGMIARREEAFLKIRSDPQKYTATRELEQLSQTPISTKIILDKLEKNIGQNVLEIGAGLGLITRNLLHRGKSVTALEPDAHLFHQLNTLVAGENLHKFNDTLETWSTGLNEVELFDSILYINVLEHIQNDITELSNAALYCQPDGKIIIFVPSEPALYGTMDWMSAHFRRYRRKELEAVVRAAGLDVHTCEYFDVVGKVPYWLMYRILRRTKLGSSSVGIYDKIIVPLSTKVPESMTRRLGGKNLILIASPKEYRLSR
jgi:2-polyprenyl-3-methyl-5-hydroxy-6-metoxy-1,4-benzoquinol methylase